MSTSSATLFLPVLLGTAVPALPSLQQSGSERLLSHADIPWVIRKASTGGSKLREGSQAGVVWVHARDRSVRIDWEASGILNQPPDYSLVPDFANNALGVYKTAMDGQELLTEYLPTACGLVDSDTLLIGGVTTGGATIVERWTFQWPPSMPVPAVDPTSGLVEVDVVLPRVTREQVLIIPAAGPHKLVSGIVGLKRSAGAPTDALVQFHEPNDIMKLRLSDGALTLIASETDPSGPLGTVQALVAKDYAGIDALERQSVGYVYSFRRGGGDFFAAGTDPVPILVLVDNTYDGTPNVAFELSETDYRDQGWHDLDNYVDWWLQ